MILANRWRLEKQVGGGVEGGKLLTHQKDVPRQPQLSTSHQAEETLNCDPYRYFYVKDSCVSLFTYDIHGG